MDERSFGSQGVFRDAWGRSVLGQQSASQPDVETAGSRARAEHPKLWAEFVADFELVMANMAVGEVAESSHEVLRSGRELGNLRGIVSGTPTQLATYSGPMLESVARGHSSASNIKTTLSDAGFFKMMDGYAGKTPPIASLIQAHDLPYADVELLGALGLSQGEKLLAAASIIEIQESSDAFPKLFRSLFEIPKDSTDWKLGNPRPTMTQFDRNWVAGWVGILAGIGLIGLNALSGAIGGVLVLPLVGALASLLAGVAAGTTGLAQLPSKEEVRSFESFREFVESVDFEELRRKEDDEVD